MSIDLGNFYLTEDYMFEKNNYAPFSKGISNKLIGAGKQFVRAVDSDVTNGVVSLLSPELGLGLLATRKSGVLEKYKK